ncbi:Neurotransmitter-gated ion-channel transmembrane region [Ancylostoma duodenale]|uniref:Neurotransmitter-gated ion-channel transmembrane region n=1 Tax=Ancylostoma duodenale TaxID=51022 RepID=A0A0C2FZT2_9BILA|nr:Neurotransmitter-gated ion-channel transmembrane region [Ancylostoma duodenale]
MTTQLATCAPELWSSIRGRCSGLHQRSCEAHAKVDIVNRSENIDLTNYVPSGEFDLVKVYQKRRVVKYTCCPEPYPDITFFIYIRRKTLYYLYNIVFPCLMMSVLTLLVFVLPPDSGEKIALGITVLLAFSVFVLAIAEKMPETSDSMPLIGIYLMVVMGMTSVSVVMTVLVLNFHHRGPFNEPVPEWARVLILQRLRKLLHMKLSHTEIDSNSKKKVSIINEIGPDLLNGGSAVAEPPRLEALLLDVPHTNLAVDRNGVTRKRPRHEDNLQAKLLKTLQILIRRQESEDASERMAVEWRQVAQVHSFFPFIT